MAFLILAETAIRQTWYGTSIRYVPALVVAGAIGVIGGLIGLLTGIMVVSEPDYARASAYASYGDAVDTLHVLVAHILTIGGGAVALLGAWALVRAWLLNRDSGSRTGRGSPTTPAAPPSPRS